MFEAKWTQTIRLTVLALSVYKTLWQQDVLYENKTGVKLS